MKLCHLLSLCAVAWATPTPQPTSQQTGHAYCLRVLSSNAEINHQLITLIGSNQANLGILNVDRTNERTHAEPYSVITAEGDKPDTYRLLHYPDEGPTQMLALSGQAGFRMLGKTEFQSKVNSQPVEYVNPQPVENPYPEPVEDLNPEPVDLEPEPVQNVNPEPENNVNLEPQEDVLSSLWAISEDKMLTYADGSKSSWFAFPSSQGWTIRWYDGSVLVTANYMPVQIELLSFANTAPA